MSLQPDGADIIILQRIEGKIDRLTEDLADLKRRTASMEERTSRVQAELYQPEVPLTRKSVGAAWAGMIR